MGRMRLFLGVVGSVLAVSFLAFNVGCSSHGKVVTGQSAEQLYASAMKELNKKGGFPYVFRGPDYDKALNRLKEIQVRHSFSPYAPLAELRIADLYFKKGEYDQAAVEYEQFIKRHPGHMETPYAMYRLALSYYKQKRSIDRDPTTLREAEKWFRRYISRYPSSQYVPQARKLLAKTRSLLAKREIYIGDYYNKRHNYHACAARYRKVVDEFYDTPVLEDALFKLGESYYRMGQYESARRALVEMLDLYPDGDRRKDLLPDDHEYRG